MRHRNHKYHLSRPTGHRFALLKNLTKALLTEERILTTTAKAKALRSYVEPLINLAKETDGETKGKGMYARRRAFDAIQDKKIVKKLFDDIAKRYNEREKKLEAENRFGKGGYTRIIRVGRRFGDGAEVCYIELVERVEKKVKKTKKKEPTLRPQM